VFDKRGTEVGRSYSQDFNLLAEDAVRRCANQAPFRRREGASAIRVEAKVDG